jgi:hypothetical protein
MVSKWFLFNYYTPLLVCVLNTTHFLGQGDIVKLGELRSVNDCDISISIKNILMAVKYYISEVGFEPTPSFEDQILSLAR